MLQRELKRMLDEFGVAVLLEAHSIASQVPRLFPGILPDFNIGTNRGQSCSRQLERRLCETLDHQSLFSHVTNARFIGGYNTRHYGQPDRGVHAVQIELSQATYLDEAELKWDDQKAAHVQNTIQDLLNTMSKWIHEQLSTCQQDRP